MAEKPRVVLRSTADGRTHMLRYTTVKGEHGIVGVVFDIGDCDYGSLKGWSQAEIGALYGNLLKAGQPHPPGGATFSIREGEPIQFCAGDTASKEELFVFLARFRGRIG